MVVLGVILLVLVAVLVLAIFVSNPDIYDLSIFGAVVQVTSAGIFLTGAITMAVTILALLLLRTGIRRGRARRKAAEGAGSLRWRCRKRHDDAGRNLDDHDHH